MKRYGLTVMVQLGIFALTSRPGMDTSATLKLPLTEKMNHPQ